MQREYKSFLMDIIDASIKIDRYVKDVSFDEFNENTLIQDAVIINLAIIGEAAKKIPSEIRQLDPDIEWKKIAGLRDILIHSYFRIDVNIIWDIVKNKIPNLKVRIGKLISKIE